MMPALNQVWLVVEPIDMRAGIDGLSQRIQNTLARSPCDGSAYAFRNRRLNRLKLLVWDGTGVWLCHRRLHQGHFTLARRRHCSVHRHRCAVAMADQRGRLAATRGSSAGALAGLNSSAKSPTRNLSNYRSKGPVHEALRPVVEYNNGMDLHAELARLKAAPELAGVGSRHRSEIHRSGTRTSRRIRSVERASQPPRHRASRRQDPDPGPHAGVGTPAPDALSARAARAFSPEERDLFQETLASDLAAAQAELAKKQAAASAAPHARARQPRPASPRSRAGSSARDLPHLRSPARRDRAAVSGIGQPRAC